MDSLSASRGSLLGDVLKKEQWVRVILQNEGLNDWKIVEGEAYCWHTMKTITMSKDEPLHSFLHEVAHALSPEAEQD